MNVQTNYSFLIDIVVHNYRPLFIGAVIERASKCSQQFLNAVRL